MRKIERQMNAAINAGKNWSNANTCVETVGSVSTVRLHGNKIAEITDTWMRIFDGDHRTNTTKSRLNALINEFCNGATDGVFQKDFAWYIMDNGQTVPFESGYVFN